MLRDNKDDFSKQLFLAFMGSDIKAWDMKNLGLEDIDVMDYLLKSVLQDNPTRLSRIRITCKTTFVAD